MKYFDLVKRVWRQGFTYKGESSKKEFLEYYLTHYLIIIIISILGRILLNIQESFYLRDDAVEIGIVFDLLNVLVKAFELFSFLYRFGSIVVQIPLTVRCLRSVRSKWYWTFLNIINPFGCLIIYFIPLRNSKK